MAKKRFIVEIDVPEKSGDLCWDDDQHGLQAFNDCIMSVMHEINLSRVVGSVNEPEEYKRFIARHNKVRESFKLICGIDDTEPD